MFSCCILEFEGFLRLDGVDMLPVGGTLDSGIQTAEEEPTVEDDLFKRELILPTIALNEEECLLPCLSHVLGLSCSVLFLMSDFDGEAGFQDIFISAFVGSPSWILGDSIVQ